MKKLGYIYTLLVVPILACIFISNPVDSKPPLLSEPKSYDIVIYGGTPAGIAAAIQGARLHKSIALVVPNSSLGGIMTNGLGGTDIDNHAEFQNSLAVGGIALEFYRKVAAAYGNLGEFEQMLKDKHKEKSLWRFEPHVAEKILTDWLQEYSIEISMNSPIKENGDGVQKSGTQIQSITTLSNRVFMGRQFIDATLEGDLLAGAGASTTFGRESNELYNETKNGIRPETTYRQFEVEVDPYVIPSNPESGLIHTIQPGSIGNFGQADEHIQAFCFRMCLSKDSKNQLPFSKPESYQRSDYEIYLRYLRAGGKLYTPSVSIPGNKTDLGAWHDLSHNLYGMNKGYPNGTYAYRDSLFQYHKNFTQGLFYFLTHDSEVGELDSSLQAAWKKWGLAKDEFKDNGGWPREFYVRDGRRLVSDYVITEHHLLKENSLAVEDPIAIAFWPPDLHSVRRIVKDGFAYNEGFVFGGDYWKPFGISYRALVPKKTECTNLITPTCPSSSHVAYGAIRIEFTFMAMGQAASIGASLAIDQNTAIQEVPYDSVKMLLDRSHQKYDASVVGIPNGE